jgi:DNA invertase Pin-like site-specific DNA recombinase
MTVYGYTRVSTERQAGEGESLDVQKRQIGGYAMMKGLEIGRVFVERGVSGSTHLNGPTTRFVNFCSRADQTMNLRRLSVAERLDAGGEVTLRRSAPACPRCSHR